MRVVPRVLSVAVVVIGLLAYATVGVAQEKSPASKPEAKAPATQSAPSDQVTFLGVSVERLHPAIRSHFPGIFEQEQGVLVVDVTPKSPAAEAGLKMHDVLLSLNDQKLTSPEQLSKLVRSDKPGQEVTFGIIRAGKAETVKAKLGSRTLKELGMGHPTNRRVFRMPGMFRQETYEKGGSATETARWQNFQSLTLKNLGENRFKVEIEYRGNEGKTEHRAFEGTLDDIRAAVDKAKDVPWAERHHVLESLGLPSIGIVMPRSES